MDYVQGLSVWVPKPLSVHPSEVVDPLVISEAPPLLQNLPVLLKQPKVVSSPEHPIFLHLYPSTQCLDLSPPFPSCPHCPPDRTVLLLGLTLTGR